MSKVFIVTGSSRGIGKAVCQHYLDAGHKVAGCSRGEGTITHENYQHYTVDVGNEEAVIEMVKQVKAKLGAIDILINNAGAAAMNNLMLTPTDSYNKIMDTNVKGTFLFSRECAKAMSKTGGKIINITTVAVPLLLKGEAIYAAAKAGIEAMTRIMAKEVEPMGITVNAIGPGPVDTDLLRGVPKDVLDELLKKLPDGQMETKGDVIEVIDELLNSDRTGEVIYLGGL